MARIGIAVFAICIALLGSTTSAQSAHVAFVDVNVVPMDHERVLAHQTVVVTGGKIAAIGPTSTTRVPPDSQRVSGGGRAYLLPGLADMHSHVMDEEDLLLYTANGVTTILHMGGAPAEMVNKTNQAIEHGAAIGPRIFFALMVDGSPQFDHFFVATPEQGRHAVELARTNGYDFIKVYNDVTAPEFRAIVDAAHHQGISVVGHGVRAVGLPRALFEGEVMMAHAEEFYYTAFHNRPDTSLIPGVVAETLRSGAFVTPNLSAIEIISRQWGRPEALRAFLRDPRAQLMTPSMRLQWSDSNYIQRKGKIEPMVAFLREFTRALQAAGVPLLTGTDSPIIPGMYPGYSIHDDLRTLVEVGLTPYEALSAATRTPGEFIARFVPRADRFGTITVGMRADLLLVAPDPLRDLATLASPLGVMSAGRWRTSQELAAAVDRQKQKYDALLRPPAAAPGGSGARRRVAAAHSNGGP